MATSIAPDSLSFDSYGKVRFLQLSSALFLQQCSSTNEDEGDHTGKRLYSACRDLLATFPPSLFEHKFDFLLFVLIFIFFFGRTVLELGCGVGAMGFALSRYTELMIMTDGEASTLDQLTRPGFDQFHREEGRSIQIHQLRWGEAKEVHPEDDDNNILIHPPHPAFFEQVDCIVATDLFYFSISIPPFLEAISHLLSLSTRPHPFFLHAHVIRVDKESLFQEMVQEGRDQALSHFILEAGESQGKEHPFGDVTFLLTCLERDVRAVQEHVQTVLPFTLSFQEMEGYRLEEEEEEGEEEEYSDLDLSADVLAMIKELQT